MPVSLELWRWKSSANSTSMDCLRRWKHGTTANYRSGENRDFSSLGRVGHARASPSFECVVLRQWAAGENLVTEQ